MNKGRLDRWLRWVRAAATTISIAALCLAVALLVIAFIPRSPVKLRLPASLLTGTHGIGGVDPGVVVDQTGLVPFKVTDPSLAQRLLYLATQFPALLLIAEIARRMAKLLRAAQDSDPFIARTARELTLLAKITAIGGVAVWAAGAAAMSLLAATVLDSGSTVEPHTTPLGWLAVGLIFAGFAQLIARGVEMQAELETVI